MFMKVFNYLAGALLLLVAAVAATSAQTPRVDEVVILEAGTYEAGPANSLQLVEARTDITARIGTKFGFRYVLRGPPSPLPVEIMLVTRLPQRGGQLDPSTGRPRFRIEDRISGSVGAEKISGYSFDAPWEIAPGIWIFEIWIAGNKLAEQRFNIARP